MLLIISLAATDILIGVESLGIFWGFFAIVLVQNFFGNKRVLWWPRMANWLMATFALMLISSVLNGTPKPISLGYSVMFVAYGFWLMVSGGNFDEKMTINSMRITLVAYFISVTIASVLIFFGIYNLNEFIIARIYVDLVGGDIRPMGFSSEPSYAAFIIAICWMSLVRLGYLNSIKRRELIVWTIIVIVSMQLLGSIYGYLLSLIVIFTVLKLLPEQKKPIIFIAVAALIFPIVLYLSQDRDARFFRIISAIFSGDLDEWLVEDTSSFFRFGPFLTYIRAANFGDFHTWMGHGASSASYFFADLFREHINSDQIAVEVGFIPAYLYDYGVICTVAFMGFLYQITTGQHRPAMMAMLLLLLFNANFNTQIIWFAVTATYFSIWKRL